MSWCNIHYKNDNWEIIAASTYSYEKDKIDAYKKGIALLKSGINEMELSIKELETKIENFKYRLCDDKKVDSCYVCPAYNYGASFCYKYMTLVAYKSELDFPVWCKLEEVK